MTATYSLFLVAALAPTGNANFRPYAACRTEARAAHTGACTWRSGSLSAFNGWYSTRIGFRHGRPQGVAILQPGTSEPSSFIPTQARGIALHIADGSSIDGDYLVCGLRPVINPYDRESKLDVACLAGAKRLHAGSIAWAFSVPPAHPRNLRRTR